MGWRVTFVGIVLWLAAQPAAAVTIKIDYTYDTSGFFSNNNPQGPAFGAQAKTAMEAAASFYSSILTDTFSVIQTPAHFVGSQPGGQATWHWNMDFDHPTTGAAMQIPDPTVPANQYIVYVGARNLAENEAGEASPGGYDSSFSYSGLTAPEETTVKATQATFQSQLVYRGQPSGFARWGGVITFDRSSPWYYDLATLPSGNVTDFYSVAIHELAHTIGFGEQSDSLSTPSEWQTHVSGSTFTGANAKAQNGGSAVPLSTPDLAHWTDGKTSKIYGTAITQEAAMDPVLQNGTRKKLTELDAAALKDIGWTLGAAPIFNGDYNNNQRVDAADYVTWRKNFGRSVTLPNDGTAGITGSDYTVWRMNFGKTPAVAGSESGAFLAGGEVPEPSAVAVAALIGLASCFVRRRA